MRLTIVIDMDNAAFEDNGRRYEVEQILNKIVNKMALLSVDKINLRDSNGNTVGYAETTEGE